ncbi:MAG TPA: c-type cytochrome [Thermodesulfobacteriota bacterium]|nr:c-type cytochrome [Thermodesulfobacteriota bacterium]
MNFVKSFIILICFFILGSVIFIYSGTYNVAATVPHSEIATWLFNTVKTSSVRKHSEVIKEPPLDDEAFVREGFEHYEEMCSGCHGAPGSDPAKEFNPAPPALSETAQEMRPAEIFWIVKNGLKMTGMPESGSTHSDDEIWGIVAFVTRLPGMTPEEYKLMKQNAAKESGHHHEHD